MNVTDIDECASSPCADGETCVDGVDGYVCDMGPHDCQGGTVDYIHGRVLSALYKLITNLDFQSHQTMSCTLTLLLYCWGTAVEHT